MPPPPVSARRLGSAARYEDNAFFNCPFDEQYLPAICAAVPIGIHELTFADRTQFISQWPLQNAPS